MKDILGRLLVLTIVVTTVGLTRAVAEPLIYAPNIEGGTVSVIDAATNAVTTTIPIGGDLLGVAVSPDTTFAYLGGFSGTVSVIDTSTNSVTASIPVGESPRAIAFTHDGAKAYVIDQDLDVVWLIDTATRSVVGSAIPVGASPASLILTTDGAYVYVVNVCGPGPCFPALPSTVSIISTATNTVVDTLHVGVRSNGIAVTPDGRFAYVANQETGSVSVIDVTARSVIGSIATGQSVSQFVTVAPDGALAYVSNTCGPTFCSTLGTVSVIDTATNSVVGVPIEVGGAPAEMVITPDGSRLYVANQTSDTVSVIDTATMTVVATVPVGRHPGFLALKAPRNAAPDCARAAAAPNVLWPPDHQMVPIRIVGVVSPDGDPVSVIVSGIAQDEAVGTDRGATCPDGAGVGTDEGFLRAERDGNGDGRVYTVSFTARDGGGGECTGTVTICVPRDQGHDDCRNSGRNADSTGPCGVKR